MKKEVTKSFSKRAKEYEAHAKIQCEIGNRLIERLDYFKIEPSRILDLGSGSGYFTAKLKQLFPKATVYGLDASLEMLHELSKKSRWRRKLVPIQADFERLPLESGTFDLIFSNQVIHWSDSIPTLLAEIKRVLSADGVFLFSTLGPDTFKEIRHAWADSSYTHTNEFRDMHDIGDELLRQHFMLPVMDMETIRLSYDSFDAMIRALKGQGVLNVSSAKNKGLTGKKAWQAFSDNFPRDERGRVELTYEVVYGQGWGSSTVNNEQGTITAIPINKISHR